MTTVRRNIRAGNGMTATGVRRDKAALSSGCKAHPAIRSSRKQPEAGMEATKCLKPSDSGSRIGDRASVAGPQTRVKRRACLEKVDVQADPATPSGEG